LKRDDELLARETHRLAPVTPPPMRRVRAIVHEWLFERRDDLVDVAEVRVIAKRLFGEQCMHRVMKVVAPLSVEAVAVLLDMTNEPRIVEITLANHHDMSTQLIGLLVHRLRYLLEQMFGAEIEDSVHRVEAQSVD